MVRRLFPQKIKIFGGGNQKLDLFEPEFQSVLFNKVKPVHSVFPNNHIEKTL